MLKQEELEKIERYIRGISDENERIYIESLFSNGENNSSLISLLQKDWNNHLATDESPTENNLPQLLDRIHHTIRKNELIKRQRPFQKFIRVYMKAAAILLLPLLVGGILFLGYLGNKNHAENGVAANSTIYAPMGSRVSFSLPDGTTGMLNSGSQLTYSIPFNRNRKVSLEGEAWFEVFRDEDNPFEIITGNSVVNVLGTSFNLSAYPSENYVEVVLESGKVNFLNKDKNESIIMFPSERLILRDGNISKSVADFSKYNAWTEGRLIFRGDPMNEVARRIERWYNVEVELVDRELENYSFRATFEDDKLINVLHLLSLTSPIRYQITAPKLLPDGTYEKEKVTFYMKN